MKFNLILHGNIDSVNNFDQRVAKLAELIDIDINFIGPFLGAKESVIMSNLEFTQARRYMTKIMDLGFKAEVRPVQKKTADDSKNSERMNLNSTPDSLLLSQKRASFKAPTDMPEDKLTPVIGQKKQAGASADKLQETNTTDELSSTDNTDGNFNKYSWSKDLDDDEVIKFEPDDDFAIKKGR